MNRFRKLLVLFTTIWCSIFILSACSSGGSSANPSGNSAAAITLYPSGPIKITNGSIQLLQLSLNNTLTAINQKLKNNVTVTSPVTITVSVSNPAIANVYVQNGKNGTFILNAPCIITSAQSYCTVRIDGLALGSTSVIASAPGYPTLTVPATSQTDPVYGFLAAIGSNGKWESASPVAISYSTVAAAPYTVNVSGILVGSSGITSSSGAIINIAPSSGGANQCSSITTLNPTCKLAFQTSQESINFTITMAGGIVANVPTGYYQPVTVAATGNSTPQLGTITLSSQNNNRPLS